MLRRSLSVSSAPLLLLAATGCASLGRGAGGGPPEPAATVRRVVDAVNGKTITFARMADAASKADFVFFGEQHDDDETHRAELALLTAIGERRGTVVLSLEMFERDVQPLVDSYLAGRVTEADFLARSRPWPNYAADYRPLVELAKAKGWPVVAANVPRRLASMVSRGGLAAVDTLAATDRRYVAMQLDCPKDQYYQNFVAVMGGGHSAGAPSATPSAAAPPTMSVDRVYEAQCVKDETMAESIAAARERAGANAIVVHFNGSFHSDFALGTVARVQRRAPQANLVVVSAVPTPTPAITDATEFLPRGRFIVLAQRLKP